jgi:Ala-tRNA(Pro) deacylase
MSAPYMGKHQFNMIRKLLNNNKVWYEVSEHKPVYTSEHAAKVRGVKLKTGVKALILKAQEEKVFMGLISADKKMNFKKLAKIIGTKKLSLASPQEVLKITGCEIGSVHPFGNLHNLMTYTDVSVLENYMVNFNAGLLTVSIQMKAKDLVKIVEPIIKDFSK